MPRQCLILLLRSERDMNDQLLQAKLYAEKYRFDRDRQQPGEVAPNLPDNRIRDALYTSELCIAKQVTPDLYDSFHNVLNRLGIPSETAEAFVYAAPEINAHCFSGSQTECILRFSSALIDILDKHEFEFVVGHELGHFLLGHGQVHNSEAETSVEAYMLGRAREISADRIGLLACHSVDVAVKALLKTVSGLSDEHLRFDVGAFLSQLRKSSGKGDQGAGATHPSILVRCKALLWFSASPAYQESDAAVISENLPVVDQRIQSDFERYVDGSIQTQIREAKEDVAMWLAALTIAEDGKFSKEEQSQFSEQFGSDTTRKMINFFSELDVNETINIIRSKLKEAEEHLKQLIPASYSAERNRLASGKHPKS